MNVWSLYPSRGKFNSCCFQILPVGIFFLSRMMCFWKVKGLLQYYFSLKSIKKYGHALGHSDLFSDVNINLSDTYFSTLIYIKIMDKHVIGM